MRLEMSRFIFREIFVKRKDWVIVANGSIARIFQSSPNDEKQWTELECLLHPEGRLHGTDLAAGEIRHSIAGRAGLARRLEPKQHARQEFAQQVSDLLRHHLNLNEIGRLVIFASNPFLGELLGHLDGETQKLLQASYPVDLTHLNLNELMQRFSAEYKLG